MGGLIVAAPVATAGPVLDHPAPVEERSASTVTSDFLPTAQIDSGVVWALKIVGNTVYAGGSFSAARPPGALAGVDTVPRANLLSFDLTTGQLSSFAPVLNGPVKSLAASPDGSRLYVGGSFTQVNGQTRFNFAAFDTATGNLLTNFKPAVGGSYVNAIVATSSTVYVGGLLGAGNGVTRKNLIAFDTNGNLLGWAPTTDLQVDTMVMNTSGSKLIVGGRFGMVNDVSQQGLAALDPATGAILPWTASSIIKDGYSDAPYAGKAGIASLSTDGNAIYGTGWVYANTTVGNLEGSFSADPETGDLNWVEDCHGDTYSSYSDGTTVYETGHPHDCESVGGYPQKAGTPGNMHNSKAWTAAAKGTLWRSPRVNSIYANWEGYPSPAMVHWFPDWTTGSATGQGQAGWTIAGSGDYLVVGGEFPYVNGKTQQGLVRFARPNVSASKDGPRLSGADWTPSVVSATAGTARITIPGNWDRDNTTLTYKITRSGLANPIYTTTMTSYFWYQPSVTFLDQGLTPGNTYTYQVSATDPDGNKVVSASTSVTVSGTSAGAYAQQVLADGATLYWRLGDTGSAADVLTTNNYGLKGSGVTVASSGAVGFGVGSHFPGTSSGRIGSNLQVGSPDGFSEEIWFNTTSDSGGKLIGFGSSQSNTSSTYDRHLYMSNNGQLNFGIFQDNTARVITSPGTYRDGNWHQAVATSGPDGAALYVDGALVGSDPTMIKAQYYLGYWRVGGDNLSGWPNRGSSDYFAGDLDEFSVYSQTLTPAQVSAQYATATGINAPTASFTSQVSDLHVAVDGSGSTARAGAGIASYTWYFGDGTPAVTGATAAHNYASVGTYTVTLSVTDTDGLTSMMSAQVQTTAHQAPIPDFTSSTTGLNVSVDASASTATDGATLSYDWNWGDGTSHGTGKTAQHTYAGPGERTITLTLTDSFGLTATLTSVVNAGHTDPNPSFTSTVNGPDVSVDASATTVFDGAAPTYSWNWGDGSSESSGVTASHTYTTDGSFDITLIASDSLGGSASRARTVTVTLPPAAPLSSTPKPKVNDTTPRVGQLIQAGTGTWKPAPVQFTYQWLRGSTAIDGETGPTYRVRPGDLGARLKVRITGSKDGYVPTTMTSALTKQVSKGSLSPAPRPAIDDRTPTVDQAVTALPGSWGPDQVGLGFQWYRVNSRGKSHRIAGATEISYTPRGTDAGYRLKVKVTGTSTGYATKSRTSASTGKIAKADFRVTPPPTLIMEGTPRIGKTLTALPGITTPEATSVSFRWYRGGTAVKGATKAVYTLGAADLGRTIEVRVRAYRAGYNTSAPHSSGATGSVQPGLPAPATPKLDHTAPVVDQLMSIANTVCPAAATDPSTYQWYRGSQRISGATQATYPVAPADVGARLRVTVSCSAPDYAAVSRTSAATRSVARAGFTGKGTVTISGTLQVGQPLSADEGTWTPSPSGYSYQWYRNGTALKGQRNSTCTPTSAGRYTVKVTATRAGYNSASVTSTAVNVQAP